MGAWIKTRMTAPKAGKPERRHVVYFRVGGRGTRQEYAGSFKDEKTARRVRDLIAGDLAIGIDPRERLNAHRNKPAPQPGLNIVWDRWARSRRDVGESTQTSYRASRERWLLILGANTTPGEVTVDDVLAGVDEMLAELAAGSVRAYLSHLAMVLEFALPDGAPNPARSRKIRFPSSRQERQIPTNTEWAVIQATIAPRSRDAVRLMECCAFRVSEACGIEDGDIDRAGGQILVRRSVTKTRAGRRWVPCPEELLDVLPLSVKAAHVYYDLVRACEKAKLPRYGTHVLRHRRISLWLRQQIDEVQVSRWAGHSKASESQDTYGHTVVDPFEDEWFGYWQRAYGATPMTRSES